MTRLYGIETEYGIAVEGRGAADLVAESRAVVRSFQGPHVADCWNYRGEDPRRDMRGFTVDHLEVDPDDAQFELPGRPRMSMAEERSDRVLGNGARLYNDHGHPEYATPECASLRDLVAHDRAGERIVLECAQRHAQASGVQVRIYKNNTDYHGASYGTHECYLMRRSVPPDAVIQGLLPFLATRQIFAGAGRVGGAEGKAFHLSQRAEHVAVEASVDTLHHRPLVNTRDEPHASRRQWRRLHVIVGDANLSEWATAVKVGATALVIGLLEEGWRPALRLKDPVQAVRHISCDQTLQWLVDHADGQKVSAIDVQRLYLSQARRRLAGCSPDADWTLAEWEAVLDALEKDIALCADRVDWVAKRMLLEQFMQAEGVGWDDPVMQSLDLAYHDVDPEAGLFAGLAEAGQMRRLVTDARVQAAVSCPPGDTRAFIRGLFVRRFPEAVRSIGWNGVAFRHRGEDLLFDMSPLVGPDVEALNEELAGAESLDQVVDVMRRPGGEGGGG